MKMFVKAYCVLAPIAALSMTACGESSPTAPTTTTTTATTGATVTLLAAPDPAIAEPSAGVTYIENDQVLEFQWKTTFAIIVRLNEGQVATNVNSLSLVLQQASGGILIAPVTGETVRFRFDTRVPGNRLEPAGEVVVEFDLFYTLPNQGKEALITVILALVNDSSVTTTDNIQLRVAP